MAREKDQMTVECDVIFLNDTKPKEWTQTFEWKPSVSFYYFLVDEDFQRIPGEVQKTWIKGNQNLWLFQSMGGQNAKGRFFEIKTESGTLNGKDWTAIMPVAEVFPDGTARMLRPPKDGKVSVPASTKTIAKPSAPIKTATAVTMAKTTTTEKTSQPVVVKPRPKPGVKFIERCFEPSTNEFFRMQDGFAMDGYILSEVANLASDATRNVLGWKNQVELNKADIGRPVPVATDEEFKAEYEKWFNHFECFLSHKRWVKTRDRMFCILQNCLTVDQVTYLVEMAWAKLPKSYYDMVREQARVRLEEIKPENKQEPSKVTATPELCQTETVAETEEDVPLSEEQPGEPVETPAPPPVPEDPVIDHTVRAIGNLKSLDKLLDYWNTTAPLYQNADKVKEAMWVWVDAKFVEASCQADVDLIMEKFPLVLFSAERIVNLRERYAKLISF